MRLGVHSPLSRDCWGRATYARRDLAPGGRGSVVRYLRSVCPVFASATVWDGSPADGCLAVAHLGCGQRLSDADQVGLEGKEDQLYAVASLCFCDEIADMGLDGGHRQPELVADLLVGQTLCDESQHLGFAIGEQVEDSSFCWSTRGSGLSYGLLPLESVEELPCWAG